MPSGAISRKLSNQFRLFFAYYDILFYVPARTCTVSFTGPDGIRHSVNVQAETLYEAVVLAIRAFREHEWRREPGASWTWKQGVRV